jgi:hypothetical protein
MQFTSKLVIAEEDVLFQRELQIDAWSVGADKAAAYAQVAEKSRQSGVTLWARERFGGIHPAAAATQRSFWRHRWAVVALFIAPIIVALNLMNSLNTDVNAGNPGGSPPASGGGNLLDRGSHLSFVTAPEAHVNSFDRILDGSLESCIEPGRDSVGP